MFLQVALLPLCQKKDKMEFEPIKDMFAYLSPSIAKCSNGGLLELYLMSQVVMNTMLLSPESGPAPTTKKLEKRRCIIRRSPGYSASLDS